MKIEKVIFENINSLLGHFEVDFTHPSLADGGLFVITGPTGVGKTSLLDAISFALYGRTARQDGVSATVNELMTRGASHCMAEVRFEKDGRRYSATTCQRRRKGRTEDALPFSAMERGFGGLAEDGTVSPLGEQKVRSVNESVEAVTGLTFANFLRCMLLAQGDFAKFLKAGDKERSEVLATITGTEIYQAIGEAVHAHKADLERELETGLRRETLPPEARAAAEQSRDAAAEKLAELSAQVKSLSTAAAWLQAVAEAAENHRKAQEALAQARTAAEAFRTDGGLADWKLAEAAQAVAPAFSAQEAARKALAACQRTITEESAFLQTLAPHLQAAEEQEKAARAALDAREPEIRSALQHLREVVRPQEQGLAMALKQAESAASAAAKAQNQAAAAAKALEASRSRETAATAALEEARGARDATLADAALAEYIPALTARLKDWQEATRRNHAAPDTPPAPTAELQSRLEALAAQRAAILAGGTRADVAARKEKLSRLQDRRNDLAQAQAAADAAQAGAERAQAALEALPPTEPAQQLVDSLTTARNALQNCSTLGEQLAALCRDFQAGTLPCCPCCGSTTPPEHLPHPLSAELVGVEHRLTAAKATLQDLQTRHDHARRALSLAQGKVQSCAAALQKALTTQAAALEALALAEAPPDLPQLITQAADDLLHLDRLEAEAAALEKETAPALLRDAFLQELAPCSPAKPAHVAAARTTLEDLVHRRDTHLTCTAAWQKAAAALELATQRVQSDATAHATALAAAQKAQEDAESARTTAQTLENKLLAERGPEPSSTTEERLLQQLDTLRKTAAATHAAAETERGKRARHEPLLLQAQGEAPALAREAQQAQNAFAAALAAHGLESADAYAAACAKLPLLPTLRQRRETLATAIAAAESQARLTQEQLDTLQARQTTTLTPDEVERQRSATETLYAQQNELHVELLAKLRADDEAHAFNARLEAGLESKRRELDEWTTLAEILGRTKDGFKRYAQKITFDLLIHHANVQLRALSDRYTLEQGAGLLSLYVRDRYQDDEARSCSNLSGGEGFVVSLALALGLSRMSGRTRIDSLFLDEGFGTLDENTLTHVLDCLQTLRADGKQVGIISHVPRLKNEIRSSLELVKRPVNGLSTFAPHPAVIARPGDVAPPNSPEARRADALAALHQAILSALAQGPSREKELRAATGKPDGLRNILRAMADSGLITFDGRLYALPGDHEP